MAESLQIRASQPEDLALIIRFIEELADYEKLSDDVVIDPTRLKEELFGEHPKAHTLIAQWDGQPVGFALYFYNFSTFQGRHGLYLEDLFVRETHRGKGIGKALFAELARIASKRDAGRLVWQVLDWNSPSIGFYESIGGRHRKGWDTYLLEGEALAALAA